MNTLSQRFREQAARAPDATALVFKDERITYATLNARTDHVARHLRSKGVGRGHVVAIDMRHSPGLVVALLAIARAGAAYVGVDPTWPLGRARDVLQDSRPTALVVDDDDTARALRFDGEIVVLPSTEAAGSAPWPHEDPLARADDLFSIVYTSGTTGRPKGVLVTLRSVVNRLEWMWNTYPFQPGDLALVYRSYTTVGFSWDCFGALLQGIPTIISSVEDTRDAIAIVKAARRAGVTHCTASVGFWEAVLDQADRHTGLWPTLRLARSSGEPLPPAVVAHWRRVFPHARLLNIYGATECSGSTAYDTALFDPAGATRVPVGRPIPGVEVIVVDDEMRPVGIGEAGELCIGGASLARGYLGDPELTAGRFVTRPAGTAGAPVFRTGDIGFWRPDGQLEITGRRDLQVKVRGYRVEIEEVEAALRACPGVRATAVHGEADRGGTRLVAFVVPEPGALPDAFAIRRALDETLPGYMVPAEFVMVEDVPRTATGKIDRTALAGLRKGAVTQAPLAGVPARTATEATVAAVWTEVLGLAEIGREDDFFDIGGHSLSGIQIVARLQDAFGLEIPLHVLFDNSSIGALAAEVDRLLQKEGSDRQPRPALPAALEPMEPGTRNVERGCLS
ncbi:MAG: non-ribosomal peptide synthetase [Vicinamibacterales bacterium]